MGKKYRDLLKRVEKLESQVKGHHEQLFDDLRQDTDMFSYRFGDVFPTLRGEVKAIIQYFRLKVGVDDARLAKVKITKEKK